RGAARLPWRARRALRARGAGALPGAARARARARPRDRGARARPPRPARPAARAGGPGGPRDARRDRPVVRRAGRLVARPRDARGAALRGRGARAELTLALPPGRGVGQVTESEFLF